MAIALAVTLTACGGPVTARTDRAATLTVLAAASLNRAFPTIGEAFTATSPSVQVRFSFAGTVALAAQIEQGAPADVFAGASTWYGDQLRTGGLIEAYRTFCTNSLALVVPASNPAGIQTPVDLTRPGVKVVIGIETVPVGAYTRAALANLDAAYGPEFSTDVLANVVSNEENVEAVLTKVRLAEADAGFVYVTDVRGSDILTIDLPAEAQATASYPIAVATASPNREAAQAFVDLVLGAEGQRVLRQAGFGPPPG